MPAVVQPGEGSWSSTIRSPPVLLHPKSGHLGQRRGLWRTPMAKALGSFGKAADSERFKRPFLHEAFHTCPPKGRLSAAPGPAGALRFVLRPARPGMRVHRPARSCGPACHSARSRRPANTSGLSHELLSQAFETRGRLGPGPVQQVWAGPPSLARRLRASPGARGAPSPVGRVSFHHRPSVRAPDNVAPSPPSPARRLSLRNSGWRTLALPLGGNRAGPAAGCPAPAPARPPRPGREATSPAAEWKPVRQVTNRWVVTVISQRMRRRSPGHSKLISSDHPLPAPATNTHRREPIKREPVRPARTLRLRERPRGTPVAPGDASPPPAAPGCRGPHWDRRTQQLRRAETGARRPGRFGDFFSDLPPPHPPPASSPAWERWDGSGSSCGSGPCRARRVRRCPAPFW